MEPRVRKKRRTPTAIVANATRPPLIHVSFPGASTAPFVCEGGWVGVGVSVGVGVGVSVGVGEAEGVEVGEGVKASVGVADGVAD